MRDIRGGAILRQIDLTFSVSEMNSKYFIITLEADRTTAEFE